MPSLRKKKPTVPSAAPAAQSVKFKKGPAKTPPKKKAPLKKKAPGKKTPSKKTPAGPKPLTIDQQAAAQAQATVAPQLAELDIGARDARSKHQTRTAQHEGWYANFADTLKGSFDRTSGALNNLIALNSQGTNESQQVLQAALNSGSAPVDQAAASMGVAAPSSANSNIMAAALANSDAQRNFLGQNALGLQAAQGARMSLAPIGRIQAGNLENARYDTEADELTSQRRGITNQIGNLTTKAKTDLENQKFQQYLARQELGLKKENQTFQQWLANEQLGLSGRQQTLAESTAVHQRNIDWANVGVNQRQVEAQLAAIDKEAKDGKDSDKRDRAKLRGEQWVKGLDMLANYLKPAEGEAPIGDESQDRKDNPLTDADESQLKTYRRRYDDALRLLTGQARMSRSDALRLLAASDFASWRQRAKRELTSLKRRGSKGAVGAAARAPRNKNGLKKKPPVPGLK